MDIAAKTVETALKNIDDDRHLFGKAMKLGLGSFATSNAWKVVASRAQDDKCLKLLNASVVRLETLPTAAVLRDQLDSDSLPLARAQVTRIQDAICEFKQTWSRCSVYSHRTPEAKETLRKITGVFTVLSFEVAEKIKRMFSTAYSASLTSAMAGDGPEAVRLLLDETKIVFSLYDMQYLFCTEEEETAFAKIQSERKTMFDVSEEWLIEMASSSEPVFAVDKLHCKFFSYMTVWIPSSDTCLHAVVTSLCRETITAFRSCVMAAARKTIVDWLLDFVGEEDAFMWAADKMTKGGAVGSLFAMTAPVCARLVAFESEELIDTSKLLSQYGYAKCAGQTGETDIMFRSEDSLSSKKNVKLSIPLALTFGHFVDGCKAVARFKQGCSGALALVLPHKCMTALRETLKDLKSAQDHWDLAYDHYKATSGAEDEQAQHLYDTFVSTRSSMKTFFVSSTAGALRRAVDGLVEAYKSFSALGLIDAVDKSDIADQGVATKLQAVLESREAKQFRKQIKNFDQCIDAPLIDPLKKILREIADDESDATKLPDEDVNYLVAKLVEVEPSVLIAARELQGCAVVASAAFRVLKPNENTVELAKIAEKLIDVHEVVLPAKFGMLLQKLKEPPVTGTQALPPVPQALPPVQAAVSVTESKIMKTEPKE